MAPAHLAEEPRPLVPDRQDRADPAAEIAVRDVVLRALARLTPRERVVIVLRFYLDLSEYQIGSELGIAPGTVKSAAARAVAKLRADADLRAEVTP